MLCFRYDVPKPKIAGARACANARWLFRSNRVDGARGRRARRGRHKTHARAPRTLPCGPDTSKGTRRTNWRAWAQNIRRTAVRGVFRTLCGGYDSSCAVAAESNGSISCMPWWRLPGQQPHLRATSVHAATSRPRQPPVDERVRTPDAIFGRHVLGSDAAVHGPPEVSFTQVCSMECRIGARRPEDRRV